MFEEPEKLPEGKQRRSKATTKLNLVNWDLLSLEELLSAYADVQKRLPALELSQMNLEKELLLQFHTVRALQNRVMDDEEVAVNQRAQVANSVASSLNRLADLQQTIYTSERFKMIEGALIRAMSKLPEKVSEKFLADYEQIITRNA
jgi:hypothetical protein